MAPPAVPKREVTMTMTLSQRRAKAGSAGLRARPAPASVCPTGNNASVTACIQDVSAPEGRQCGQSAHSPMRSRAVPLNSTKRHPGVHPGPTFRRQRKHLIRSPGLCRWQRSQSGRPRPGGLVHGGRAAWANGDRHPAPSGVSPAAASSPSVELLPRHARLWARAPALASTCGTISKDSSPGRR